MLWSNIRSWAKDNGYKAERTKISSDDNDEETSYQYIWYKIQNPEICGETTSVSKVAKAIYNDITDNKHIEHQEEYTIQQQKIIEEGNY